MVKLIQDTPLAEMPDLLRHLDRSVEQRTMSAEERAAWDEAILAVLEWEDVHGSTTLH